MEAAAPVPILECACGYRGEFTTAMPLNGTPRDALPLPGEALTACCRCGRVYHLSLASVWEPFDVETLDPAQRAEVRRLQAAIHRLRGIPS